MRVFGKILKTHVFFFLFLSFFPSTSKAQVVVSDSTYSIQNTIYSNIEWYVPHQEESFKKVFRTAKFQPLAQQKYFTPNLGMHKKSIWLRFKVKNKSDTTVNLALNVENPNLWVANLYTILPDGSIDSIKGGNVLPFDQRLINSPDFVFHISLMPEAENIYYLKLKSDYPLFVPLSINKPAAQFNRSAVKNAYSFAFMCIILVMILYNGFIAFATKDKAYWAYIIFLLFLGLAQLSYEGFGFMYLWSDYPNFNKISIILFSNLAGISVVYFAYPFLQLKKHGNKLIHIVFSCFIIFLVISSILDILDYSRLSFIIMQLTTFLGSIMLLIVSGYLLKKSPNAKFFFVAWSLLLICSIVFILKDYGIFPANKFTEHIVQLGAVIEIILLSIGLANRINTLQKEKAFSQLAALKLAKENELITREQNIILEKQVAERTQALSSSNEALGKSVQNLQKAQSKLVATEKMSSLGQLTAGIAHEINNPINFVTANVNPLRRDIHQLFDSITKIEAIGIQEKPNKEKIQEIKTYKEEQDLDYMQTEINQLLDGIHEGASRTADIVKGLRTFSRLDEDDLKRTNINDGLKSTLAVSSNLLRGIKVDLQLGDIPIVTCYPGKVNQVFLNIITNAIFAIREKHGQSTGGLLSLKTYEKGGYVYISIKDDGIGMDETTKEKLYEPFFTTKKVGEGTGLGMSIVFTIIEQHNATLTVNSTQGVGSEFILRLSIAPSEHPKEDKSTITQINDVNK